LAGIEQQVRRLTVTDDLTVIDHLRQTVKLALPVIGTRLGVIVMMTVDVAMTGRHSSVELAYLGLGVSPMIVLMLVGIGMLMGTAILSAQAQGAGEDETCGTIWQVSLVHALIMGALFLILAQAAEFFFHAIEQPADLARGGGQVARIFGWQMPAIFLAAACMGFLESVGRPNIGAVAFLIANFLNAGLNWFLIYGHAIGPFDIAPQGAAGAVGATAIVRWLIAFALIIAVLTLKERERLGIGRWFGGPFLIGRKLRRIGYPMALAQGIETSAFAIMSILSGYLGALAVSAYQIAINILVLTFMGAVGTATAAGIRVGIAVGRRNLRAMTMAGWSALAIIVMFMVVVGSVLISFPESLAGLYSDDPAVIAIASGAVVITGLFIAFDGSQAVMIGALRGAGDVWIPLLIQILSFQMIAVPVAAVLAFQAGLGVNGMMIGLFCGVVSATLLACLRFHVVSRRDVRRV
jgi:MATE family multidrug resistance protein